MPTERFVCLATGAGLMLALLFIGAHRLPPHWDKAAHFVCFAVITADDPGRMVVARMGAPLLLGLGDGENFAASDTAALLQVTRRMIHLEEGDCAEVTLKTVTIVDARGHAVERPLHVSQLAADAIELGNYRHYMQKEIFEQPAAVAATLEAIVKATSVVPQVFGAQAAEVFGATE